MFGTPKPPKPPSPPSAAESFMRMLQGQQAMYLPSRLGMGLGMAAYRPTNVETQNPEGTLALIKKSIKEIKAEAVGEKAQAKVQAKINRLKELDVIAQAQVLEAELQVRVKLMRVQEWDYKVLPAEAIEKYSVTGRNWDGIGGRYQVHVDLLEAYVGTDKGGDPKDKIIPDDVLDELDKAKERQVFDKYFVLWVEKVKDPLLLGSIDGCKDYFFICEWGDDVTFDQIMKNKV